MDHRDRIESPSVERRKLIEKRMEMVGLLFQRMGEGESCGEDRKESDQNENKKRISKTDCYGKTRMYWVRRFVNVVHGMFP
ncbi:hypothetical protein FHS15_003804 [Paenibacillus castaneae]|uniref:hypothetical protein n=1 Tax=Paenibacillus castaneae TaxID=474957 RepID=UPI000C9A9E29|nr:hypothetical protein [Paenibacillus castaneae]NIK78658.1 hypothetical protein [Paenibacillus castaneae]